MKRICPVCNTEFDGRIDKKFCCDQCRNTFNNSQNQKTNSETYQVNKILKNNRKILFNVYQTKKKVVKEKLMSEGFRFDYMTNIYITQKEKTYYYCYDMGYWIEDNIVFIVEKKDYIE